MRKLLTTTSFLMALAVTPAMADMHMQGHNKNNMSALELSQTADTVREENAYHYEFNRDEQCQGYFWGVKRLGITNACDNDDEVVTRAADNEMQILNEYVVYFDFDESDIRDQDEDVLRQAARDISRYNPSRVLVAGYTDTEGSMDYNRALSSRRADSVSQYLTSMGVSNTVVNQRALGETELAVPTPDSTRMQQNRRVVVQFVE
jgi:outer membrane protein OmpA-like peptidoglycan-associated protein